MREPSTIRRYRWGVCRIPDAEARQYAPNTPEGEVYTRSAGGSMETGSGRVAAGEKIGYALGDIATNFFFQSLILYQTRFYTDTVGLSAVALGTMFLVLRIAEAFVDPVIGALCDRTQTRWGKFRPWVLGTAVPFGVIFWLV